MRLPLIDIFPILCKQIKIKNGIFRLDNRYSYVSVLENVTKELNDDLLTEALESLQLETSGTLRERCARLRRGVKLYKGMSSHASDVTSLTTDATDLDDKELPSDEAATSLPTTSPVTSAVESIVMTTSITTLATGVVNSANSSEIANKKVAFWHGYDIPRKHNSSANLCYPR